MNYFDKIDNFPKANKAQEVLETILRMNEDLYTLYLTDVISNGQYEEITDELYKKRDEIMESLKQFYNEQKKVS